MVKRQRSQVQRPIDRDRQLRCSKKKLPFMEIAASFSTPMSELLTLPPFRHSLGLVFDWYQA